MADEQTEKVKQAFVDHGIPSDIAEEAIEKGGGDLSTQEGVDAALNSVGYPSGIINVPTEPEEPEVEPEVEPEAQSNESVNPASKSKKEGK